DPRGNSGATGLWGIRHEQEIPDESFYPSEPTSLERRGMNLRIEAGFEVSQHLLRDGVYRRWLKGKLLASGRISENGRQELDRALFVSHRNAHAGDVA